jgi:hypothetical protein
MRFAGEDPEPIEPPIRQFFPQHSNFDSKNVEVAIFSQLPGQVAECFLEHALERRLGILFLG